MIVASLIATIQLDNMDSDRIDDLLGDDYEDGDYSTDASQYLNGDSQFPCTPLNANPLTR